MPKAIRAESCALRRIEERMRWAGFIEPHAVLGTYARCSDYRQTMIGSSLPQTLRSRRHHYPSFWLEWPEAQVTEQVSRRSRTGL